MANKREAPRMDAPKVKRSKIAEMMMAKQGYVKGQGLGREGQGIVEAIEVQLRPQGAGLGAVREKTAQAKAEEKRAAERRGEEYLDSSEEERKQKKLQRLASRAHHGTGAGTGAGTLRRTLRYRTANEADTEENLATPSTKLIDLTGKGIQRITLRPDIVSSDALAADGKPIGLAQLDLEAFADSWHAAQEDKTHVSRLEAQILQDLSVQERDQAAAHILSDLIDSLSTLKLYTGNTSDMAAVSFSEVDVLRDRLLKVKSSGMIDVEEACVAVVGPMFVQAMAAWEPLEDPTPEVLECLKRLKVFIHHSDRSAEEADSETEEGLASPYESLLRQHWLPKMRRTVVNDWKPENAILLLSIVLQWKEVLTPSVLYALVNGIIVRKLQERLKNWKPQAHKRNKDADNPQTWLAPWLLLLDDYHKDPRSATGLMSQFRRKIRAALELWSLQGAREAIAILQPWRKDTTIWREISRDLELRLLPRLASYLRDHFEVNPTDQETYEPALSHILEWRPLFGIDKFARIFVEAFFPKWYNVLFLWLTHQPDYDEIIKWIRWWRDDRLRCFASVPAIEAEWLKGLELARKAQELGPDRMQAELEIPAASATAERKPHTERAPSSPKFEEQEELSMRDLVEEKCEEESLILKPMREADPKTGQPLFRISASASGTGGVVVKFHGDLIFARGKRDREHWEAFDPFEEGVLSAMAMTK